MPRRLASLVAAVVLATACSTPQPAHMTQECANAAAQHAALEIEWLVAAAEHTAAHISGGIDVDTHAEIESKARATRVDALIAEAATRHHCN